MKVDHTHAPPVHRSAAPRHASPRPAGETTASASPEELKQEKILTASGKNAASPAHRARDLMAEYEQLGQLRFGQVVSMLARGEDPLSRIPDGGETAAEPEAAIPAVEDGIDGGPAAGENEQATEAPGTNPETASSEPGGATPANATDTSYEEALVESLEEVHIDATA